VISTAKKSKSTRGDRSERGMKMPNNKGKRCSETIDKGIDRYRQEVREEGMERYVTIGGLRAGCRGGGGGV
jgi:predicted adenine nucleotide alpha hydrolase (AANH) superfamily ATPase